MLLDTITRLAAAIAAQDAPTGQRLHRQLAALVGRECADMIALRLELERLEKGAMVA